MCCSNFYWGQLFWGGLGCWGGVLVVVVIVFVIRSILVHYVVGTEVEGPLVGIVVRPQLVGILDKLT